MRLYNVLKSGARAHRASGIPGLREGEAVTVFESDGPGLITHIWFTFPPKDRMFGRRNLLRIFWDEEAEPSVEAPLGDFFGVPFGFTGTEYSFASRYVAVAPTNALNCYFPMPFAKHARIEIFSEQPQSGGGFYYQVDYLKLPQLPEDWADLRFHAQFRFENPCENYGRNYLFLDAAGEGMLVGASFGIEANEPQPDAWVHGGGDTIFIDGERLPNVLHGIGAEDFFGQSWGVRPFQSDYIGTPYYELDEGGGFKRAVVYRFFVEDPVVFTHSIRGVLGALGNSYSSVGYWYQKEPHRRFFGTPRADDRMPGCIARYGAYDIEPADSPEWKLLGPFRIDGKNPFDELRLFETGETGSEQFIYEAEGEPTLPGGNKMAVRWIAQRAYHNFLDFNTVARPAVKNINLQTGVVGYALRYVQSDEDKEVAISVGFDDDLAVRINEEQVFRASHPDGFREETFKARLRKGSNRILVKLSNYDNSTWRLWAFSFRIE